jgi:predicted nucleic acid-binding protein
MDLVIDASVSVAQALRSAGRQLLRHTHLQLYASSEVASETAHELRRRVESMVTRGHVSEFDAVVLLADAESTIADAVTVLSRDAYIHRLPDATWRIPRDPTDAATIALALSLDCGIWTSDRDFFGCGLPVWSTEVLQRYLESLPRSTSDDTPSP